MNRPSPPKPWERSGGGASSTSNIVPPPRSTSPNNTNNISNTQQINTTQNPLTNSIGSNGNTNTNSIVTRPRTPMRPTYGGSGVNSPYGGGDLDSYSMRPSSYGGGGGGYGSSYGGSGYGGSSYGSSYGGSGYGSSYGGGGYGSSYGGSGYGSSYGGSGYGSSYGGSGYGSSYSSPYGGGYGSSYGGGYGSSYGGGGYGYRGMNDPFGDPTKGPLSAISNGGHTWMEALHSVVDTFSRFSRLLDANFDAVHVSFTSVLRLCHSMSHFNHEVFSILKTFTLFKLFQSVASRILKLFRFILGRSNSNSKTVTTAAAVAGSNISKTSLNSISETLQGIDVSDFKNFEKKNSQSGGIGTFILIIAVTFIGLPMLIGQLINVSRRKKGEATLEKSWGLEEVTKVRAIHDFDAETPRDLPLRVGDVVNVIGQPHQEWWEGEINGRTGLFPISYVCILDNNNNNSGSSSSNNNLNNNSISTNNDNVFNNNNKYNNNMDDFSNNSSYQLQTNYSSSSENNNINNNNNNNNTTTTTNNRRPNSPKKSYQQSTPQP